MKHALFTMARHIVSLLLFVQRFPVFLLFLMGLAPLWLCHRVRTVHFFLVGYIKIWVWLYFKLNGIRIDYNKAQLRQFDQDIVVCNYSAMIDYAVLFLVFPYKKIIIVDNVFFNRNFLKKMFYALGFFPEDKRFSIRDYASKEFSVELYLDNSFSLLEALDIKNQGADALPNSIVMAIKKKKKVQFLRFNGSKECRFSTIFTPKTIKIDVLDGLDVCRRPELTILKYETALEQYR